MAMEKRLILCLMSYFCGNMAMFYIIILLEDTVMTHFNFYRIHQIFMYPLLVLQRVHDAMYSNKVLKEEEKQASSIADSQPQLSCTFIILFHSKPTGRSCGHKAQS
ncbi:hypothetical protein AMECASPLE_026456 [Ameca splendens]|uniref:Uncharacterized protein n=1 Tax=Ameca splendens TaxID=208324 RepID=A0ABV0ZFT7_9TELE